MSYFTRLKQINKAKAKNERKQSALTLEIAAALREVKLIKQGKLQPQSLKDI